MKYHHVGFPARRTVGQDVFLRHFCPPPPAVEENPFRLRWKAKSDLPNLDIIRRIAHVAFEVEDIGATIKDKIILTEPIYNSKGEVEVFIEIDEAPILLINAPECNRQIGAEGSRFKYHSFWIPTNLERKDDIYLPDLKMHVYDPKNEFRVGWVRYDEDAPYPRVVKNIPHIAFEVEDIEHEIAGEKVIITPNSPAPGLIVAFIEFMGVPVEFLQIDRNLIEI